MYLHVLSLPAELLIKIRVVQLQGDAMLRTHYEVYKARLARARACRNQPQGLVQALTETKNNGNEYTNIKIIVTAFIQICNCPYMCVINPFLILCGALEVNKPT